MTQHEIHDKLLEINELNDIGRYSESEKIARQLLDDDAIADFPDLELRSKIVLSSVLQIRGFSKDALEIAEGALVLAHANDNEDIKEIVTKLLTIVGNSHIHLSNYSEAIAAFYEALQIAESIDDPNLISDVLCHIGNIYKDIADFPNALKNYEQALSFAKYSDSKTFEGRVLNGIGIVYQNLGDFPRAFEYFKKVLALLEEKGSPAHIATALGNLGIVSQNLGDSNVAMEYMLRALSLEEQVGNKSGAARHLGNLGQVHLETNQFEKGLESLQRALEIDRELGNRVNETIWKTLIGTVYANSEFAGFNPDIAEEYLLEGIRNGIEVNSLLFVCEARRTLAELYEGQERWKEHSLMYKEYHKLEKEILSEETASQTRMLENRRKIEESERDRQVKLARFQEQEKILHNILPNQIAERMVLGEKTIADAHENVSVFFSDIVGFTKLSQQVSAVELVEILNGIFTQFDQLARKHGLEKIKTIGDAYMAVCGAPIAYTNHAERTAMFALEVSEIMKEYQTSSGVRAKVRIGLHSGSVVAGIIGENKFAYDMWGDAVNTAARMESHGEPDKIHVSEEFRNSTGDKFTFIERGEMDIKGKGMMKTYFLEQQI